MTSLNSPTTSQLDVLRNAIKDQCTSNSTALDNHQEDAKDISIIALELIDEKMHQLLSCDKNITDLKAYGKFEDREAFKEKAFFMILNYLFSECSDLRASCHTYFREMKNPPSTIDFLSNEFTTKLLKDGVYTNWMTEEIRKGNVGALETWNVLIRMMGKALHQTGSGVQVLNSLLQIVELAFKSSNQELKKAGYLSWRVLMDNFALDQQVLSSSKRIKLITRPLVGAIGNKCEDQINAKFDAWWYYISLQNKNLSEQVDTIVVPFFNFCFSSTTSNVGNGLSNQHRLTGLQSPAKRFNSIRTRCLEATAILIGGLNNVRVTRLAISNLESVKEGVIKPPQYFKHHKFFLGCVEESFGMINVKDRTEVNYFKAMFQSIVHLTEKITKGNINPSYEETLKSVVNSFFVLIENMLESIERTEDGFSVALMILEELKKLPVNVLTTMKNRPVNDNRKYPPAATILQLMLKKDFIRTAYLLRGSSLKDRYLAVFEKLISISASSKDNGLAALDIVLITVKNEVSDLFTVATKAHLVSSNSSKNNSNDIEMKNSLANLWKIVATYFKNHIDKHSEVNQSKTASLNHDLSACKNVLLHPFEMFPDVSSRAVWNKWADLYRQINMLAALVVTYKSLELERYLSQEGSKLLLKASPIAMQSFVNFCQYLSQQMVSSIPFPTYQDRDSESSAETSIKEIKPVVELLVELSRKALSTDFRDKKSFLTGCSTLCLQLTNILANVSNKGMIRQLFKHVVPALVAFLSLYSTHGHGFEKQVKDMYDQALSMLNAGYEEHSSVQILLDAKKFIVCALAHSNRDVRSKAYQMWLQTFANSVRNQDIPKEVNDALKNHSGIISFDSSISSSSQNHKDGTFAALKTAANPLLNFGHFFDRGKQENEIFKDSPSKSIPDVNIEHPKTPTSATKWIKPTMKSNSSEKNSRRRKLLIEDESSQDFVKISSPGVKKRPLTDHQKDLMTSRRDDIPALYSELSRDDSQVGPLPAQFNSQNLLEAKTSMNSPKTQDEKSNSLLEHSINDPNVKIEKDIEHSEDISKEYSMSIIAPQKNHEKLIPSTKEIYKKGDNIIEETEGLRTQPLQQSKKNEYGKIVDTNISSHPSTAEESFSSQEEAESKTSSSRRKLRMPKKNAHLANRMSPRQKRKSKRKSGPEADVSPNSLDKLALNAVDKENEKSGGIFNIPTIGQQNLETNSVALRKKIVERKSRSKSSSSSAYSPVTNVTRAGKKRIATKEELTKIIPLPFESSIEGSENSSSVLKDINAKYDGIRTSFSSPCRSKNEASVLKVSTVTDLVESNEMKVCVERLSPQNEEISSKSPVKVIKESPLRIVPVIDSNERSPVARKINFDRHNRKNLEKADSTDIGVQDAPTLTNASRKRRISTITGNASKKLKSLTSTTINETTFSDKDVDISRSSGSETKRSKRIARKAKQKTEILSDHSIESDSSNLTIGNVSLALNQSESKCTTSDDKGDKQPVQKMRLNKYGESPLHVAVKRGDLDKVRSLLLEGADVNSKDHAGWRPIHEAMREGDNALNIIRLLVEHNANINALSDSGSTALHDAAAYMSEEIIEYLIKSGADPAIENLDGKTPLHIAKMPQYARTKQILQLLTLTPCNAISSCGISKFYCPKPTTYSDTENTPSPKKIITDEKRSDMQMCTDQDSEKKYETRVKESKNLATSEQDEIAKIIEEGPVIKDKETSIIVRSIEDTKPNTLTTDGEMLSDNGIDSSNCNSPSLIKVDDIQTSNRSHSITNTSSNVVMTSELKAVEKFITNEVKTVTKITESSSLSNTHSDALQEKTANQDNGDEMSYQEINESKLTASTPKLFNVTNEIVSKRNERRQSMPSPYGPGSRGAKLLLMANKKSKLANNISLPAGNSNLNNSFTEFSNSTSTANDESRHETGIDNISVPSLSKFVLMSPRIESRKGLTSPLPSSSHAQEKDLLATPKSLQDPNTSKPWQKFAPSPSSASPTASILKRTESPVSLEHVDGSEGVNSDIKRRRVKFTDPPVSEQVEIPRTQLTGGPGSGGTTISGPNKATTLAYSPPSNSIKLAQRPENKSSSAVTPFKNGNDQPANGDGSVANDCNDLILNSHKTDINECIEAPFIVTSSKEPITSILNHLTNKTFYKAAKKSLEENGVNTIADLCKLTPAQIVNIKGLKPPNNITAIKEALKKFEKVLQKREIINMANNALYNKGLPENGSMSPKEAFVDKTASRLITAPFMESTTPDEEDKALQEIYERPSPSPTEMEQDAASEDMFDTDNFNEPELESASKIKQTDLLLTNTIECPLPTPQDIPETTIAMNEFDDQREKPMKSSAILNDKNGQKEEKGVAMINASTQAAEPKVDLINVETSTEDLVNSSIMCSAEVQAAVNTTAKSCQAIVDTSEVGLQTSPISQEEKIQNMYDLAKIFDANTLSKVIGGFHGILQEKISRL